VFRRQRFSELRHAVQIDQVDREDFRLRVNVDFPKKLKAGKFGPKELALMGPATNSQNSAKLANRALPGSL